MNKRIAKHSFIQIFIAGAVLLIINAFSAFSASAHSLYIQSGRYVVSTGKSSPLFFCFGHHFPVDDGVRSKKLHNIKVMQPDGNIKEIAIKNERTLHSYEVKYEMPGTYVLTAETNPGFFAMYIDKKGRKRHSLKPKHTWIDNAVEIESSMRSSQWTKTYVTCEKPSEKFPAFVGLPLELVPINENFSSLKEGDTLELQVYFNGKPYKKEGIWDATYGGFSSEAEDLFYPNTTIHDGKIVIPLQHSGRWFVRFYTKTDVPKGKQEDSLQEKRTTTLSFLVTNERIRPKEEH